MSIDYNTFVGPFFKCRCPKADGKPSVNQWNVSDEIKDSLYVPNSNYGPIEETAESETHIWKINRHPKEPIIPPGYIERETSHDDFPAIHPIAPEQIEAERQYLAKNFEVEQNVLRQFYGKENVTLCWGIINYCS